jgi:hypothetical protein
MHNLNAGSQQNQILKTPESEYVRGNSRKLKWIPFCGPQHKAVNIMIINQERAFDRSSCAPATIENRMRPSITRPGVPARQLIGVLGSSNFIQRLLAGWGRFFSRKPGFQKLKWV